MSWHDITKDPTDLPKKDGFCDIAYLRTGGAQRTAKAFYRVEPKKEYYRDESGKSKCKIANAGWNIQNTARAKTILAWREREDFTPCKEDQ